MYIIIVGAGVGGYHLAGVLSGEGHSVVVVEQSEATLGTVRRYLDVKTISGSGANPRVLREAEAQRADLLIAATASDDTNMVVCFLAKALGTKRTVARVRNPEYSGYLVASAKSSIAPRRVVTPETLGITLLVNPDLIAAQEILDILSSYYTAPIAEFADGRVQAREFRVENAEMADKPIRDLAFPKPCSVAVVIRADNVLMPRGDEIIKEGDHVWVVAAKENMNQVGATFGKPAPQAKNIVILGAEHTGFRLAQLAEKRNMRVKLIDPDAARCQRAAEQLERTVVMESTGTDKDVLIDEGVPSSDAFVAATSNDELNILVALLAKNLGTRRSLVLVEKPQYVPLAEAVGLDVVISPLLLTASKVARLVRSSAVLSVSFLGGMQIEAVEFLANQNTPIVNHPLKEVQLLEGVVLGAIVTTNSVTIPRTDSVVKPGDHVIAFGLPSAIRALEKLFEQI